MDDDNAFAIVGVGCKFPGADNLDEFWRVLLNGENHVIEIPPERWNVDAFYNEDPMEPGKTNVRRAGFIRKYDMWDNKLFGVSQVETARIDPQQRYVLDCVHMAMEDGGITREDLNETDTGVYIGAMNDDYRESANDELTAMTNYTLTGSSLSIIAARVSYIYNLLGPSMCIDTACSSSLVAIHLAIQAIKSGDCKAAICGGVNSILYPHIFVPLSKARMVSATGQCQAFSDTADGYARGEGCGMVIIKSLKQAKLDGNKIWSVIVTGCNQDGHTATPITAPSGRQQSALLERVYHDYKVDPKTIQYVEAHGTGTPVGDPIEANSLGSFFSKGKHIPEGETDVRIGSVKTNIGHLESAAGIAGLIKVMLMMHHGKVVPSLHYRKSNPKIDFGSFSFEVATSITDWDTLPDGTRMSCVNSFGFGGTNSHAIIKQIPNTEVKHEINCDFDKPVDHFVTLSAVDISSIKTGLERFATKLKTGKYSICDVSYTSVMKRDHFGYRVAFAAKDCIELAEKCEKQANSMKTVKTPGFSKPNIVFLCCGVGTSWNGMCKEMMGKEPVFRAEVERVDSLLRPLCGWSIADRFCDGIDVQDPLTSHLAIFTCQIAHAKLWEFYGITPDAVLGQSVGEVAAAYISGALSLSDAIEVIYHRSRILANATGGKMMVVGKCPVDHVQSVCDKFPGQINIAVQNSPVSCTLSGDSDVIDEVSSMLSEDEELKEKPFIKQLDVKCAYHSHHTEQASAELETHLDGLSGQRPACSLISTVTGELSREGDFTTANYWKRNVRMPVLLQQGIETASKSGPYNIYVEIGPRPVLRAHLPDIIDPKEAGAFASMTTDKEYSTISTSLLELYKQGCNPKWDNLVSHGQLTDIPTYAFNEVKSLFEPDTRRLMVQGIGNVNTNHLCVERIPGEGIHFRIDINPSKTPFVYEHVVGGNILLPGAFYSDVALEIGKQVFETSMQNLQISTRFLRPLRLVQGKASVPEAMVTEETKSKATFGVFNNDDKIAHCTISTDISENSPKHLDLLLIRKRCKSTQTAAETYGKLESLGFAYGDDLKIIGNAIRNETECLVDINLTDAILRDLHTTNVHPAVLDGLLQTSGVLDIDADKSMTVLPGGIGRLRINRPLERHMYAYVQMVERTEENMTYNALLLSKDGSVIVEVKDFMVVIIGPQQESKKKMAYRLQWQRKKISISVGKEAEKISTVIVALTKDKAVKLAEGLLNTDAKIVLAESKSFTDDLSAILNDPQQRPQSLVFIAGSQEHINDSGTDELYQAVLKNCSTMLSISQTMAQVNVNIPAFVITKGTQETRNSDASVFSVLGAELWGMVRCIIREHPLNVTLLDTHLSLENTAPLLRTLMTGGNQTLQDLPELLLLEDGIFANEFAEDDEEGCDSRWVDFDEGFELQLKSKHPDDIRDTFYIIQQEQNNDGNHLSLTLESVVLHDPDVYPLTLQSAESNVPLWIEDNQDGFDVLTFEALGYPTDRKQDRTVACYPMRVQSKVTIPKDCTCKIGDIPGYKPGLLQLAAIVWQLKESVSKVSTTIVSRRNDSSISPAMMKAMLSTCEGMESTCVTYEDLCNSSLGNTAETLVVLSSVNGQGLARMIEACTNIKRVLSLQMYLSKAVARASERLYPDIQYVTLDNEEMLGQKQLEKAVPKVIKWLMKNADKLNIETAVLGKSLSLTRKKSGSSGDNKKLKISKDQALRRDGCYIVTGGLTGLGWEIVQYLSQNGAGQIVTLSRRQPDDAKKAEIKQLEDNTKSNIAYLSADVSNNTSVEEAFRTIESTFPQYKIKGIFHGAGVLADSMFFKMTEEHLQKVLLPKVVGSWNLHKASKGYNLDFFVMHSSMTSVMGNIGQSNYGAGNAFMDSLAHLRKANGMCGQSINWGPLSVGMLKDNKTEDDLAMRGYLSLDVPKIITCLQNAMMMEIPQITYGIFDWNIVGRELLNPTMLRVRQRFKTFVNAGKSRKNQTAIELDYDLDTIENITKFIIAVASEVLGIDADMLTPATAFNELGVDSMLAMTFANQISEVTNCQIPIITLMSEDTTIGSIAEYLLENMSEEEEEDESMEHKLTFPEKRYYDKYLNDPMSPGLFICLDIDVMIAISVPEIWKSFLYQIHGKYPLMRTLFVPDEDSETQGEIKKIVISPEDVEVDFQEVQLREISSTDRIPSPRERYMFNPEKDLPLRILYANDGKKCRMRFVFNHLCFDNASVMLFLGEIQAFGRSYPDIPITMPTTTNDIPKMVYKRLKKDATPMETFWRNRIPNNLKPVTFLPSSDHKCDPSRVAFARIQTPRKLIGRISKLVEKNNWTLFQFMQTTYQLYLHLVLGLDCIPLLTIIDLRLHFPALNKDIATLVNTVPLFQEFSNDALQLMDMITENAGKTRKCLENSLLPLKEIEKIVSEQLEPLSVLRHQIIFEESSVSKEVRMEDTNFEEVLPDSVLSSANAQKPMIQMVNTLTGSYSKESVMRVWHDRTTHEIDLELEYNSGFIDRKAGKDFLNAYIKMLEKLVRKPQRTLGDIKEQLGQKFLKKGRGFSEKLRKRQRKLGNSGTRYGKASRQMIHQGSFYKQTKSGWDHEVELSLLDFDMDGKSLSVLRWGEEEEKKLEFSKVSQIRKTSLGEMQALIVKNCHRDYVFKTRDPYILDDWVKSIKRRLSSVSDSVPQKTLMIENGPTVLESKTDVVLNRARSMDSAYDTFDEEETSMSSQGFHKSSSTVFSDVPHTYL
ncbi:phthiocerol/phenolphthiocerol synthesis polyketide synthase type I PpsD-like [Pecten maximus]|uniref:phthiocerol/phenolphthiocerol synthesis polyketide synthase type I PpsD-like n=1 Tax=Pecten maximus TaxID=6579 RepID=UPI001458C5F8|nr:phthiocerol/phenolphthiocerol synthesis polyketide synthase type I PpsD-like [Pecten maximus]